MMKTPFVTCVTNVFGPKFSDCVRNKCLTYVVPSARLRKLSPRFKTPTCQADLDPTRVQEMFASYQANPEFMAFKKTIVLAAVAACDTLYTVDGQHRLRMAEQHDLEEEFTVVVFNIQSDAEMNALFVEINKDSLKSAGFVSMGIDAQQRCAEFKELLECKYSALFASERKAKTDRVQTLTSFLRELGKTPYIDQFVSADAILDDLEAASDAFCKSVDVLEAELYKEDSAQFKNKFMPPLTRCNFVEFLNDRSVEPFYERKVKRAPVSKKVRLESWKNEFGEAESGKCPKCCVVVMNRDEKYGWHAGHIKSHKNGGKEVAANLRPICATCNGKMNSQNWVD
jgi:hypothetical protein